MMKNRYTYSLAFLFTFFLIAGVQSSQAQLVTQEGDITAGAGLSYGTDIEEIGLTVQAYYAFTNEIRGGGSFTYYFTGDNWNANEFNVDVHYLFRNEDGLILYGLGGLNFSTVSVSFMGQSNSETDTGLNIGGGVEYDLGSVYLFGEPKFTIGGFEQLQLTAGVRLRF